LIALPTGCVTVSEAAEFEHYEFPRGYRPDLHNGEFYFDAKAAGLAVNFAPMFLRHTKGVDGPLILERWQQAIIATLFGWKRKCDDKRRYRVMYMEVARGNGKSTMCVVIACLLMFLDGEIGAEIVGGAFTREQAREVFGVFRVNVMQSPSLGPQCTVMKDSVVFEDAQTGVPKAVYKIITADGDANQGGNYHGVIVDELHVQKDRWFWDTLRGGAIKRKQPLTVAITTAGSDRESICYEQRLYAEAVCKTPCGDEAMAEFLPVIYAADPGDDWREPATWRKANPNLNVSIGEEEIRKESLKAAQSPGYLNTFLRLHCNIWTAQSCLCLNIENWDACETGEDSPADVRDRLLSQMIGEECYGGLDMAGREDVAAFVLWFPERKLLLPWFWVPRAMVERRKSNPSNLGRYYKWASEGFMETTSGEWIDEAVIQAKIVELNQAYSIRQIAYDSWNADATRMVLEREGIDCVKFAQAMSTFAGPFKKLKEMIDTRQLHHANNPVLRWMAVNTAEITDTNANARPCKKRSPDKIDGIVSSVMAIGIEMAHATAVSYYDTQDLEVF
jgi:phage terminase large subunit-like protein